MRHFTCVQDLGDLKQALNEAFEIKKDRFQFSELGKNKTLLMIFFNSSLRTRLSTQKAAMNLGMNTIVLDVNQGAWKLETERGVTIVKDRQNVKRYYMSGSRLRCYTGSRALVQFFLCAIQSAILSLSYIGVAVVYGNDLPEKGLVTNYPMLEFYISILLLMYAADAMGIMISCLVRKEEAANVLAPYILIVQLIFSGILFNMEGMADYISYIMISKWGMEALGSIADLNNLQLKIQMTVPNVPHDFENRFEATSGHLLMVWAILAGFTVAFLLIGNILLHRVSKDTRG